VFVQGPTFLSMSKVYGQPVFEVKRCLPHFRIEGLPGQTQSVGHAPRHK
jgi:hypothetical protein